MCDKCRASRGWRDLAQMLCEVGSWSYCKSLLWVAGGVLSEPSVSTIPLAEQFVNHPPMYVSQAEIAAGEFVSELLVIEPHQMQNRRV